MNSTLKIVLIQLYCFCCIVVCFCENVDRNSFQITRGKYDTFKILNWTNGAHCAKQCTEYNAKCFDDDSHSCRCKKSSAQTTFIGSLSDPRSGRCTKHEDIIPESVPAEGFMLKNEDYNLCLTVEEKNDELKLAVANCSSSLNKRWIFIKQKQKLMNLATLQCLDFTNVGSTDNECNVTIKRKSCHVTGGHVIRVHQGGLIWSQLKKRNFYLKLDNEGHLLAVRAPNASPSGQRWTNRADNKLKLNKIDYNGCYRFKKPKPFMLYLDTKTCPGNPCYHQFYAPILFRSKTCRVVWSNSKIMNSAAVEWSALPKDINESLISIEHESNDGVKNLKVTQDALKTFSGSLLRLDISCNNTRENQIERHCLLLKFRSLEEDVKH